MPRVAFALILCAAGCSCGSFTTPSRVPLTTPPVQLPDLDAPFQAPLGHFLVPARKSSAHELREAAARCRSGRGRTATVPSRPAMLVASASDGEIPGRVLLADEVLVKLDDGDRPRADDLRDRLLVPAYDRLLDLREAAEQVHANAGCGPWGTDAPFPGNLLLVVDDRLPASTVETLLHTAETSGFLRLFIAAEHASESARTVPVRGPTPPVRVPGASVLVTGDGFRIADAATSVAPPLHRDETCATLPCSRPEAYPVERLGKALQEVRVRRDELVVAFEPSTRWATGAHAVAAAHEAGFSRVFVLESPFPEGPEAPAVAPPEARGPAAPRTWTERTLVPVVPVLRPRVGL